MISWVIQKCGPYLRKRSFWCLLIIISVMTGNDLNDIFFCEIAKMKWKKQKFCSREAKMRAILTSCPHRRERHLQSAKPWQGGVRGLSLEIVDLAIFGHNFEISAHKTEHIAHLLKRAHGQLDRDNPHPHLPPWDEKKIMEQKSWQRALRALHEDYHQSWQNFKIAPIYLPSLRNTNLILQRCDAITFSIKGHRPILIIIKSFSEPQYPKSINEEELPLITHKGWPLPS